MSPRASYRICNALEDKGFRRCTLAYKHKGRHSDGSATWPNHAERLRTDDEERAELRRSKGLKHQSDKGGDRAERWAFIKRCFMAWLPVCAACGVDGDSVHLDLDHITPAGRGGAWEPENAQLLCRPCHRRKHGEPWSETA